MRYAESLVVGLMVMTPVASQALAGHLTPRQIYEGTASGVVYIDGHEETGKGSAGTGFIIHKDGLAMTNAHVVINAATGKPYSRLIVVLKPERVTGRSEDDFVHRAKARVLAVDRQLDLALMKIEPGTVPLPVLPLGDPTVVGIGDWVAAIGHPEQGGLWTFTTGVVSAEFEDFDKIAGKNVFQTEIGLNRGNSGGPLLNADGQVIGINTSIARLAQDGLPITHISFSVKANVMHQWLKKQGYRLTYGSVPTSSALPPQAEPSTPAKKPPDHAGPLPQKPRMPAATSEEFRTEPRPYSQEEVTDRLRRLEGEMENLIKDMERPFRSHK